MAPSDVNSQLLAAINDLSRTIRGLQEHIKDPEGAGAARASAPSIILPGAVGASAPIHQASLAAEAQARQTAQQEAQAEFARSQSATSESKPPDAAPSNTSTERAAQQDDSALKALTWETLGGIGGPLGRFRTQQYANKQYVDLAARATGNIGRSMQDHFEQRQSDNLASPDGASSLQTGLNKAGSWIGQNLERPSNNLSAGITGVQSAYLVGSGWAQAGRDLGYGSAQQNAGWLGFHNPAAMLSSAGGQGASLALEQQTLMGRNPFMHLGGGMTSDNAKATVQTLAAEGFSNQNGVSGDNLNIATNLVKPLVNQGVSVQGAADWTVALRNSNTSISQLMDSLGGLSKAARGAKESTDTYNSSLLQFAQTQVQMGGTAGQAAETGVAFTRATGMDPGVLGTLQQNKLYQGEMLMQQGVLPSGIPDLTPGAQLQGVTSIMQLLGGSGGAGGLGGMFGALNHNKYEGSGNLRVPSAYGSQLEASQMSSMLGIPQSDVMRYMRQMPHMRHINNVESYLGSSSAQDLQGNQGTGLWNILDKGGTAHWNQMTKANQVKATDYWNKYINPDIKNLGLKPQELKDLNATKNIHKRAQMLQDDLLGKQKDNPQNTIKVDISLKGKADKMFTAKARNAVQLNAHAGGAAPNTLAGSPLGAALAANPDIGGLGLFRGSQ